MIQRYLLFILSSLSLTLLHYPTYAVAQQQAFGNLPACAIPCANAAARSVSCSTDDMLCLCNTRRFTDLTITCVNVNFNAYYYLLRLINNHHHHNLINRNDFRIYHYIQYTNHNLVLDHPPTYFYQFQYTSDQCRISQQYCLPRHDSCRPANKHPQRSWKIRHLYGYSSTGCLSSWPSIDNHGDLDIRSTASEINNCIPNNIIIISHLYQNFGYSRFLCIRFDNHNTSYCVIRCISCPLSKIL